MRPRKTLILFSIAFFCILHIQAQSEEKNPLDKKSAFVALLVSYSNTKKENNKNLLENVKSSNTTSLSVKSVGGYFLKQNFALGIGFDYASDNDESENINTFGPNTFIDRKIHTFTFTPFMRNYFPIGLNNRFFIFTQTGLELSLGNGEEVSTTSDTTTSVDIEKYQYGIAFTPGVIFLVQKGFAFEVNVGVLGFNHSKETNAPTDGEDSIITKTNFNFDINLLKLNLGISYYF